MRALLARLLALFHRRRLDDELSDEMAAHLELSTADHVARGLSLEDARRRHYPTLLGGVLRQRGLTQSKQWRLGEALTAFEEAAASFEAA